MDYGFGSNRVKQCHFCKALLTRRERHVVLYACNTSHKSFQIATAYPPCCQLCTNLPSLQRVAPVNAALNHGCMNARKEELCSFAHRFLSLRIQGRLKCDPNSRLRAVCAKHAGILARHGITSTRPDTALNPRVPITAQQKYEDVSRTKFFLQLGHRCASFDSRSRGHEWPSNVGLSWPAYARPAASVL